MYIFLLYIIIIVALFSQAHGGRYTFYFWFICNNPPFTFATLLFLELAEISVHS